MSGRRPRLLGPEGRARICRAGVAGIDYLTELNLSPIDCSGKTPRKILIAFGLSAICKGPQPTGRYLILMLIKSR